MLGIKTSRYSAAIAGKAAFCAIWSIQYLKPPEIGNGSFQSEPWNHITPISERASQITPLKSYLDAGFLVAGGTDSPVVPFNPFFAMYHFLTRDTITDGIYGANERVASRAELIRLITINYAKLTGEADIKGSIEPGKLADFAALSEDLLTVAEAKIPATRAMLTYVGGREVYRDVAMK